MSRIVILLLSVVLMSFSEIARQPDVKLRNGQVFVRDKLYCLFEEPEPGSRSFQIKTPSGEVVIVGRVRVEGIPGSGQVDNYFSVLLIPSGRELNIKYSKKFPDRFLKSLIAKDVIQNGDWSEYGAIQLFNEWNTDEDAIFRPAKTEYVLNEQLTRRLESTIIDIGPDKRITIDDTICYQYTTRDNRTRNHRYWQGSDQLYYRIYDLDSNLCAEVAIGHHRSKVPRNISIVMMPEKDMFYLRNISCEEKAVVKAAVKLMLVRKWK